MVSCKIPKNIEYERGLKSIHQEQNSRVKSKSQKQNKKVETNTITFTHVLNIENQKEPKYQNSPSIILTKTSRT